MAKKGKSPTDINAMKGRINLIKNTVQTEMRWLMGRMLAQQLTRELPKGFACQYVKASKVDLIMSDALVISNSSGVVLVRIRAMYPPSAPILLNMWVYKLASWRDAVITPAGRRLLKVLERWAKEFGLTSNLNAESEAHMASLMRLEQARQEDRQ